MKTLTVTQARRNLGELCLAAGRGEAIGIISGHRVFQLKPVEVVPWDDTYAAKEYGVTLKEMDTFLARAEADAVRKQKRGDYVHFKGKFDPKALE